MAGNEMAMRLSRFCGVPRLQGARKGVRRDLRRLRLADLDVLAEVIPQDLQRDVPPSGKGNRPPLAQTVAGGRRPIAVFREQRLQSALPRDVVREVPVDDGVDRVENAPVVNVILVVRGGIRDVEVVALRGVPFGVEPVERERHLRDDVGDDGVLRPRRVDLAARDVFDVIDERDRDDLRVRTGRAEVDADGLRDDDLPPRFFDIRRRDRTAGLPAFRLRDQFDVRRILRGAELVGRNDDDPLQLRRKPVARRSLQHPHRDGLPGGFVGKDLLADHADGHIPRLDDAQVHGRIRAFPRIGRKAGCDGRRQHGKGHVPVGVADAGAAAPSAAGQNDRRALQDGPVRLSDIDDEGSSVFCQNRVSPLRFGALPPLWRALFLLYAPEVRFVQAKRRKKRDAIRFGGKHSERDMDFFA